MLGAPVPTKPHLKTSFQQDRSSHQRLLQLTEQTAVATDNLLFLSPSIGSHKQEAGNCRIPFTPVSFKVPLHFNVQLEDRKARVLSI